MAACSTGGGAQTYGRKGSNRFTIEEFLRPLEQTAALCGMEWETPFVLHASAARMKRPCRARPWPIAGGCWPWSEEAAA